MVNHRGLGISRMNVTNWALALAMSSGFAEARLAEDRFADAAMRRCKARKRRERAG
jgi:hypothetical protein